MKQEKPTQTQHSTHTWRHTTKAAAAFVLTTATYLLARTTGFLPSWLGGETEDAVALQESAIVPRLDRGIQELGAELSVMSMDLPSGDRPRIKSRDDSKREPRDDGFEFAGQRRLLQTSSGVTVTNPIPDQIIEATEVYQYDLKNIFAGNYTLMTVSLANGSVLPSWLSAPYLLLSSYDTPSSAYAVQVLNGLAYVPDYSSGLQVLNTSNPSNISYVGSYNTPGNAQDVQLQNGVAYVADDISGLQVLNISNPRNITRLGSYDTAGNAQSVQVQNGIAYIADLTVGLQVLNVSNPSNITYLGNYNTNTTRYAVDVQVQNGLAYLADAISGLHILNVSNPLNITRLGGYSISAAGVQVQNGLAYVAADTIGLQILNISNPGNTTYVSSYNTAGQAVGVQVQNGVAYVADYGSGLQVLNVSNPTTITRLGSYDTPGSSRSVQVQNGLAYVADGSSGLQIIDVRQSVLSGTPTTARVGEIDTIRVSVYDESGQAIAYENFQLTIARFPHRVDTSLIDRSVLPSQTLLVDLDSDVLFTDPNSGMLILTMQISAVTTNNQLMNAVMRLSPIFLGNYGTSSATRDVQIQNNLAYVADGNSGLQILDVSYPAAITYLGSYNTPGLALSVQVQNGLAYVADYLSGLQVLNVSNPLNIIRLGSYDTPGSAVGVQVQNGLAYIADSYSGLQVLNVNNPGNITYLGSYGTSAYAVQIQNGLAYIASNSLGLQILNISNPSNITLLNSYNTLGVAQNVQVQNDLAYVASATSGLQILNVSNPLNIIRLGSYDTPGLAQGVQVRNGLAYVADDDLGGLQILNVSNPRTITWLGSYNTPGFAYAVQVQNDLAYVADDSAGLQILDLTQWELTASLTFAEVGNYRVTITATNELGGTASDSFELRVEGGPKLNSNITIPQLFAKVGVPFNYFIPQGLLSDPNNDPISFSARSADNSSLPGWLNFNGISATFSGLAQSSNVGNYSLRIIATDNIPGTLNAETVFNLFVDHLPYVNQRVADQVAGVGFLYNFTVPSSTFIDPDNGDVLSYSARQRDGSALPIWLTFNPSARRFVGTPSLANADSYSLVLSASDTHNGTAQTDFNLLVEQFPVANANQTLIVPVAGIGQPWAMTLPADSFVDGDDTQFTYRITRADGSSLPSWLSFNPFSGALLGVPQSTELGVNTWRVMASDPHGGSAYRDFNVTVVYFPSVANAIPKPAPSRILRPFNFTIPSQTFSDLDSPVLSYNASLSNSQPLPAWLNFNAQSLVLSGTPNLTDAGTFNLLIQAQDTTSGSIGVPMEVVIQPNFPPQLSTQISNQAANVLEPFDFYVPTNTFQDGNGDALNYSACLSGGGQFPAWLKFDATTLHFHGTPSRSDTGDFSQRTLSVDFIAADDLSQTTTNFKISVQGNSNLALFFKIGGPLFTLAGLAFGLYKKRSLLINRCQKEKYQKLNHTAVMGETFFYQLETPVNQVAKVQAKLPSEAKGNDLVNFFKSSHDRLPGHLEMPNWMMYDTETNAVRSKGRVPVALQYKQLIIQVKDAANITREEFVLDVLPASTLTNTTGEQIAIGVDEIKHVPQSESEGLVDPISPDSPSPSGHSNPFGFLSSSQSVLRSGASSPTPKKAKVEEVIGRGMELTTVSATGNTF